MQSNSIQDDDDMKFGRFTISANQVFYRSSLSAAFVNLRPIVPGHVLIIPKRVVPHLADLTTEEYQDLWASVREVQTMLQRNLSENNSNKVLSFNVAVQDGRAAGQSVPHVHVHILPRTEGDFERNDDVYDRLEEWAPRDEDKLAKPRLEVPEDNERRDRTMEEMIEEASQYKKWLTTTSAL